MLGPALEKLAYLVRTMRLTKGDDPLHEKGIQEVISLLEPVLAQRGALHLTVQAQHLALEGQVVYEQPNRAESLAFRLFREGVDCLVLEPGLDAEALRFVLESLAIPRELAEQLGEDLVTRLWANPRRGLWVTERPWHSLQMLEPYNQDANLLRAYVADAMVFLTSAPPSREQGAVVDAQGAIEAWFSLAQRQRRLPERSPVMTGVFEPLQAKTDIHGALELLGRFLSTTMRTAPEEISGAVLEDLLLSLVRSLLLMGEEETLEYIYEVLGELEKRDDVRGQQARRVMIRGASTISMQQLLLGSVSQPGAHREAWVPQFFARHTHNTPQEFYPLFSLNLTDEALRLLLRVLWSISGPSVEVWLPLLEKAPAEIAHELLHFLRQQGHEGLSNALYRRAIHHRSAQVRRTAVECAPLRAGSQLHPTLVTGLQDDDIEVRVATLRRFGRANDPQIGIFLVDQLRRDYFSAAPEREQRALLESLLAVGGERYINLLLDQLDFLQLQWSQQEAARPALQRTCELLLEALGRLRRTSTLMALRKRTERAPAPLQQAYQRSIEALEMHMEVPPALLARTTLHNLPSVEEGPPMESSENLPTAPSLVEMHNETSNLDALLNAYVYDDTAQMQALAVHRAEASEASDDLWDPLQLPEMGALETLLRDYLGSSADSLLEELSHQGDPSSAPMLRADPRREILTSSPHLDVAWTEEAMMDLEEAQLASDALDSPPDTFGNPLAPPTPADDTQWDALSGEEDSQDPDMSLNDISGATSLDGMVFENEDQWLEHFSDPELDDEIEDLIDDLMGEEGSRQGEDPEPTP